MLCGYNRCADAIDFHHIDESTKRFAISDGLYSYTLNTLKTELRKCVRICSNCHREIHAGVTFLDG